MRKKVIVSLTSYPKRMNTISDVIKNLCNQTYKADKIVLYLAKDQFTSEVLPQELAKFSDCGFEIHWCDEDLKSHKKYYYAFQEYPDDIVITVDDDFCYSEHMIEELMNYHVQFPQCVIARRTHLMTLNDMAVDGAV